MTVGLKLLFVVNVDWFFLSHRLPIALEAVKNGFEVHLATEVTDRLEELRAHGIVVHPIRFDRSQIKPLNTLCAIWCLFRLLYLLKPDLVHLVTIKPVLFGGILSRLVGVRAVVAAFSGLGIVFVEKGIKAALRRCLVGKLYGLALGKDNLKVVFQNERDRQVIARLTRLPSSKTVLIRGAGVDLERYRPRPMPNGRPVVVMASRLLITKGVREFVAAAQILKQQGHDARFCLVGEIDPGNPTSVARNELQDWQRRHIVECWGYRSDMPEVIAVSHMVVLPSYYGEGLPKILMEAAACGRAVVTTDWPGCRDAIVNNETGMLVPPKDPVALAEAMGYLLNHKTRCREMGVAGRTLAEREYSINGVVRAHMRIYNELIINT